MRKRKDMGALVRRYKELQKRMGLDREHDGERPLDISKALTLRELAAFGRTFDGGTPEDVRDRALCGLTLYGASSLNGVVCIPPVLRWAIEELVEVNGGRASLDGPLFHSFKTGQKLTEDDMHALFRQRCKAAGISCEGRDMDTFVETGKMMGLEAVDEVPQDENTTLSGLLGKMGEIWEKRLDTALKVLFGFVDVEDAEKEGGA